MILCTPPLTCNCFRAAARKRRSTYIHRHHIQKECFEDSFLYLMTIIRKLFLEEFTIRNNTHFILSLYISTGERHALQVGDRIEISVVFMPSENQYYLCVKHTSSICFCKPWTRRCPKVVALLSVDIFTKFRWASTSMSVNLKINLEIQEVLPSLDMMMQGCKL